MSILEDVDFELELIHRDEILELLEGEKPTLLQGKTTGERIPRRIIGFVETFINGIAG